MLWRPRADRDAATRHPSPSPCPARSQAGHALRERSAGCRLPMLLAPAIHYAEEGFPVTEVIAGRWAASVDTLSAASRRGKDVSSSSGRAPAAGEVFRNPDLARIAARASPSAAADGFYRGPMAEAIVATLAEDSGGTDHRRRPVGVRARVGASRSRRPIAAGRSSEIPPNGQGIAALMMLNIMERFRWPTTGFHSAAGAARR